MHYTPDALRDFNRSTSAFGAASTCRTHSYAMPMDILNPIRLCTQADSQSADPYVPNPRSPPSPQWDTERCSASPFDVPWQTGGPTSIGTVPGDTMQLLAFNGWDIDGPQPLRQCTTSADCCAECACLLTPHGSICAILQTGIFECLVHNHCANASHMCAGDGLCTRPALEITNSEANEPISFRTYSSNCSSAGFDTWGTSKEEIIPDLLQNSGMCSYRSWFEQRQIIASSGQCSASSCAVRGSDLWNFTAPDLSPKPAFAAGVLRVQPHACDMEYEHLAGLTSCSPKAEFRLVDAAGALVGTLTRVNRTRTYRLDQQAPILPVVRHTLTNNLGAGFFSPTLNYLDLGYDSYMTPGTGAKPQLCSNLALCATQAAWRLWKVNGVSEPSRIVNSIPRPYNTSDMIACGAAGFLISSTKCTIDPLVAPLFYYLCTTFQPTHTLCLTTYPNYQYTAYQSVNGLAKVASDLNSLLTLMRTTSVTSWDTYLAAVSSASTIYASLSSLRSSANQYYATGAPTGLYYLMHYAAYELPYAWWFRCSWLMGITPSAEPAPCAAWAPSFANTTTRDSTTSSVYFNQPSTSTVKTPLLQWLASHPDGVFFPNDVDTARNAAHAALAALLVAPALSPPTFACHPAAYLRDDLLQTDADYRLRAEMQSGLPWTQATPSCTGFETCLDHGPTVPKTLLSLAADVLKLLNTPTPCAACTNKCATNIIPSICSLMQDQVPVSIPADQTWLPLFHPAPPSLPSVPTPAMVLKYDPKTTTGCNTYPSCRTDPPHASCQCLFTTDVQAAEVAYSTLSPSEIQADVPPMLSFSRNHLAIQALDVCDQTPTLQSRCSLYSQPLFDSCDATNTAAQTTKSLYCDTWSSNPPFRNDNPKSNQCLISPCLPQPIASTLIAVPPGIVASAVDAPPIPCYTLHCPNPSSSSNDGATVLDPTPFTYNVYSQTRLFMYQVDFILPLATTQPLKGRSRRIQLIDGNNEAVVLNAKYKVCYEMKSFVAAFNPSAINIRQLELDGTLCHSNLRGTRSLSQDFNLDTHTLARNYAYQDQTTAVYSREEYKAMVQDIVRRVEDYVNTSNTQTNYGRTCSQARPQPISYCNFTSPSNNTQTNALALADDCTEEETKGACLDLGTGLCSGKSNAKTYDAGVCATACAAAGVLAAVLVPFPFGFAFVAAAEETVRRSMKECQQGPTDYEQCFSEFTDVGTCVSKYKLKCNVYVYQRNENRSPCTATAKTCAYDNAWETKYSEERGLPTTGFCPECTGSGCGVMQKSSKTFQVAQAGSRMHALTSYRVRDGDMLGADARYVRIGLGTLGGAAVQCGRPGSCGVLRKALEIRKNLFTCVPCLAAARTQCVGEHMCGFNGTTLSEAYADVVAQIGRVVAGVDKGSGLGPRWAPWLTAYDFEEYNPSAVVQGFNQAILKLNGQCQNDGALPDPSKCQNDLPRRTLGAHVDKEYRVEEAAVVPGGHTLSWSVTRAQLTTTNVPAWEATSGRSLFARAMLSDKVCERFTFESLVCLKRGGSTLVYNPQIAGDFEVQDGCDTSVVDGSRVISSACNQLACPTRTDTSDGYNMYDGSDPTSSLKWTGCKRRNRATPSFFTTPSYVPTNLCGMKPARPSVCGVGQGAWGTRWGRATDLYARTTRSGVTDLAANSMTLAQLVGVKTNDVVGNLAVSMWDMGGHYVRLGLTAGKQLVLRELPLRSFVSLQQAQEMNASTTWAAEWMAEKRVVTSPSSCKSWRCPFRRRAFVSAGLVVPGPERTRAIFGTTSHPSSVVNDSRVDGGGYVTRNGLCVCRGTDDAACVAAFQSNGNCSRADLIEALMDGRPRLAVVLDAMPSRQQLDWPWAGGMLRDGSFLPNRVGSSHAVLDRLPAFRYRFVSVDRKIPQPQTSTLDEGGDCHMGRAARSGVGLDGCVVSKKTADAVTMRCAGGVDRVLVRPRSASVTRRLCTQCDPPPTFYVNNQSLPEAETSFGTLWRWSPSRLLARDLRFKLCGNATACPAVSDWTMSDFWRRMKAGTLFGSSGATNNVDAQFASSRIRDDDARWDTPWLLCTTNASGKTCSGQISKDAWLGGDRTQTCRAIQSQPNAPSAAVDMSICDLDSRMNQLCTVIQGARYRLFEANCRLTGRCRSTAFFYQPATYSLDDGRFARSTVGQFYNFTMPGSCPVTDEETMAVLASNAIAVQNCPAQDLEALSFAIDAARAAVHFFVKIVYYFGVIGLQLLSLVAGGDSSGPIATVMAYFNLIASEFQQFFAAMGDIVYKMVMETGQLGQTLKLIVTTMCHFLSDIFVTIVQPFMCIIKSGVVVLLDAVAAVIGGISMVTGGALDGAQGGIKAARDSVDAARVCGEDGNPFENCDGLFRADADPPTALPMPTRCWVGYQPAIGDQGGLGCTAADTCMDDDGTLRACASCVGGGAGYGCDSLTKLCRFIHAIYDGPRNGSVE